MPDPSPQPRDWSGIGCALVIAAFFAFVVYYRWPDPEGDLVKQRQAVAEFLTEYGATLTPADASHPANPQITFSPRRLRLGDQPYHAIQLPYGSHKHFVVPRAKELFPEVVDWSFTSPETSLVRLLGSEKAVDVVRHFDRLEVQRLSGEVLPHRDAPSLAYHPPRGAPFAAPPDIAQQISQALLDPDAYEWGDAHLCDPAPGVRLTFHRGNDQVDFLLCFECGLLDTYFAGRFITSQSFDHSRDALATAMKELFPDDEQIQAIEPR